MEMLQWILEILGSADASKDLIAGPFAYFTIEDIEKETKRKSREIRRVRRRRRRRLRK